MSAWVLLEVPPHGCCPPCPETTGRVVEWCGRNAGRRSAGLGSEGAAQGQSHAVGVRARVRLPRATRIRADDVSGGNHRQWRICADDRHWRFRRWQKHEKKSQLRQRCFLQWLKYSVYGFSFYRIIDVNICFINILPIKWLIHY